MQAARIPALLLAVAPWAVPCLALAASAAAGPDRAGELLASPFADIFALLQAAYQRAPVLVIVLSALLLLPVLALASYLVQRTARARSERDAIVALARKAETSEWPGDVPVPATRSIPVRLNEAWLVIGDSGGETVPLAAQVTRIGRHQDNDIRLVDASVHRHHAVIERTANAEFVIADLSGKEGNGVRINGVRLERAHLVDGDVIEIGRARLRFESVPI